MCAPHRARPTGRRLWTVVLAAVLALPAVLPGVASAEPWGMKQIPQPPGLPRPPQPWNRDQDRGRDDDTARRRDWQEQQQRDARERNDRERNDRERRWDHEQRRERWDGAGGRPGWDTRPGPWMRPGPPPVYVVPAPRRYYPRPRYGAVVPVLPWAATVIAVGSATYWYCDGVYYRRLPADAGYQVVDEPPVGDGRIVDERLYVYPRSGQSAEQQASDEYECHRWAVDQTGFDPSSDSAWNTQDLQRRDDYRRAQTACLDGRGYTVK